MSYPALSNHLLFVKFAVIEDQVYFHVLEYFCVVHYNRALEYRLPLPIWFNFSVKREIKTHYYIVQNLFEKIRQKMKLNTVSHAAKAKKLFDLSITSYTIFSCE